MSAVILTNVTGGQYGEVQRYRVYYYPQLSVTVNYSNSVTGSATYTIPILDTGRTPLYYGIVATYLPTNAYIQGVSLSSNTLSLTLYFSSTTVSGTVSIATLVIQ